MVIDQAEIDSLLKQAGELAAEASDEVGTPAPPVPSRWPDDPEVQRILRLRVPVIVRLAHRMMTIRQIRKLGPGAIVEFGKSVEAALDLMINNHPIGGGTCVKIGEHFGLRLSHIRSKADRIRSMGR